MQNSTAQTSCTVNGIGIIATGAARHEYGTFAEFCTPSVYTGDGAWSYTTIGGFVRYTFSSAITSADIKFDVVDGNPFPDIGEITVNGGGIVSLCNPCGFIINGATVQGIDGITGTASIRVSSTLPFTSITYSNSPGFIGNGVFQANLCEFVLNPGACITVPITLQSFTAASNNCITTLRWTSATEINAGNYELQTSTDGINFSTAAIQRATGRASHYTYSVARSSDSYYRLKLVDNDGHFVYSSVIFQATNCETHSYSLLPNPAKDFVSIKGFQNGDKIEVFDLAGKKVSLQNNFSRINGLINVQYMIPGTYIVKIISAKNRKTVALKMIKK